VDSSPPDRGTGQTENEAEAAERDDQTNTQRGMSSQSRKIKPVQSVKEPPIGALRRV
jgi:hypothetical protein